jgi:hypothetical protein
MKIYHQCKLQQFFPGRTSYTHAWIEDWLAFEGLFIRYRGENWEVGIAYRKFGIVEEDK